MQIFETSKGYEIKFDYNPVLVKAVKAIKGSRYLGGESKTWLVPKSKEIELEVFKKRFNVVDQNVLHAPETYDAIPDLPQLDMEIALKLTMFPYQATGVAYNIIHRRVLIGDQPGLGKTVQAIASTVALNGFPCIVACPSGLKINWKKEWQMWTTKRVIILEDSVKKSWPQFVKVGLADVVIVNYESVRKYFIKDINIPEKQSMKLEHVTFREEINLFKTLICDESHRLKNNSTQWTKFCKGLSYGKENRFLLSGTPVVNKPKDLLPQLSILGQLAPIFKDSKRFTDRYCEGGKGASNLKELNYLLNKHCFYRREKSEVMKDLPAKIRQVMLCDITNRKEYTMAQNEFVKYLKEVKGCTDKETKKKMKGLVMVKLGILKQLSAKGKIDAIIETVDDVLDAGEKIIIFCHHTEIVQTFLKIYPGAVTITGSDNNVQRDHAVTAFQKDPKVQVIICSIKAAGVGLTLTAASRVAFAEFPWHFADCEQCEDRAHRIGQKDSVEAKYFLGENTIDRWCYDLILTKKQIANDVTGASDDVSEEIIDSLLNNLLNQS